MGQQESHDGMYTDADGEQRSSSNHPPLDETNRIPPDTSTPKTRRMEKLINRAKAFDPRRGKHRSRHDSENSNTSLSTLGGNTPRPSPLVSRPPTTSRSFSVPLAAEESQHDSSFDIEDENCMYNRLASTPCDANGDDSDVVPACAMLPPHMSESNEDKVGHLC